MSEVGPGGTADCPACGYRVAGGIARCPSCGRRLSPLRAGEAPVGAPPPPEQPPTLPSWAEGVNPEALPEWARGSVGMPRAPAELPAADEPGGGTPPSQGGWTAPSAGGWTPPSQGGWAPPSAGGWTAPSPTAGAPGLEDGGGGAADASPPPDEPTAPLVGASTAPPGAPPAPPGWGPAPPPGGSPPPPPGWRPAPPPPGYAPPPAPGYGAPPPPGYGPAPGYGPPPPPGYGPPPPPGYGPPSPGWPPGGWPPGPVATGPKNDGVASAALVVGLVSVLAWFTLLPAVIAIVLGIAALRRLSRSGGASGGRALAVIGMAVATVSLIAGIATDVAIAHSDLFTGHIVTYADIQTGDCVNLPKGLFRVYRRVSCDHAHDREVYGTFESTSSSGGYPGVSEFLAQANQQCPPQLRAYAPTIDGTRYRATYLYPRPTSWDNGERKVICMLRSASGAKLTSSVRISGTAS